VSKLGKVIWAIKRFGSVRVRVFTKFEFPYINYTRVFLANALYIPKNIEITRQGDSLGKRV
jgi:hypothetical protein